ncbi:MAG: DUF2671 domain-containing protein [Alphaproteobacteria bacterium]|nr:DUF2671 domain-containing protein [Alphaproteobacteria bacterium]
MAYTNPLLRKLNLPARGAGANQEGEDEAARFDLMTDARYLRQSSSLINEALQKGFDVLQLANGDVVTTGTKIVSYQYTWDDEKAKMVRVKTSAKGRRRAEEGAEGEAVESDADEDLSDELA